MSRKTITHEKIGNDNEEMDNEKTLAFGKK